MLHFMDNFDFDAAIPGFGRQDEVHNFVPTAYQSRRPLCICKAKLLGEQLRAVCIVAVSPEK
jgi:hypothetical protein